MICPKCAHVKRYGYESKHGGYSPNCSSCGYKFILTPNSSGVSDRWILKVLDSVSSGNTTYFTKEQLINQALSGKRRQLGYGNAALVFITVLTVLILALITADSTTIPSEIKGVLAAILMTFLIFPIIFGYRKGDSKQLVATLEKYLDEKPNPFLLTSDTAQKLMKKLDKSNLQDFHPDKVLIVDDLDYAVLLLLNDFHRNENCLILTEDMRPENSFKYFKKRQAAGEDFPVFLLHDIEPDADWSIDNVSKNTDWGLKPEQITDLGLKPDDLINCKTGIWYHPQTNDVQVHIKKEEYIQEKIKDGWIFPIDSLPLKKLQPALGYCMENKCALMSTTMLAAMPMILGAPLNGSELPSDTGFDDFG